MEMGKLKKICGAFVVFAFVLFSPLFFVTAEAADTSKSFSFELSVDGKDTKEVETGDIITVVLRLKRTDASEQYTMYAMQDELRYDSTFFELVEDSVSLSDGIVSTDLVVADRYQELYMNYLSMNGGEQWETDTMVGSFQLKVIGMEGVSTISNQDYLVSVQDGSGSYQCIGADVTVIISTECIVRFQTSGGSEIADVRVQFGEKLTRPENPVREGYTFEGWYKDIHLTEEWDFEEDTVCGNMSLYAKWSENGAGGGGESNTPEDSTGESSSAAVDSEPTGDSGLRGAYGIGIVLLLVLLLFVIYRKKQKKE